MSPEIKETFEHYIKKEHIYYNDNNEIDYLKTLKSYDIKNVERDFFYQLNICEENEGGDSKLKPIINSLLGVVSILSYNNGNNDFDYETTEIIILNHGNFP